MTCASKRERNMFFVKKDFVLVGNYWTGIAFRIRLSFLWFLFYFIASRNPPGHGGGLNCEADNGCEGVCLRVCVCVLPVWVATRWTRAY